MTEREYSQLIVLVKNRKIFLEIIVTFLEVFRKLCQKILSIPTRIRSFRKAQERLRPP